MGCVNKFRILRRRRLIIRRPAYFFSSIIGAYQYHFLSFEGDVDQRMMTVVAGCGGLYNDRPCFHRFSSVDSNHNPAAIVSVMIFHSNMSSFCSELAFDSRSRGGIRIHHPSNYIRCLQISAVWLLFHRNIETRAYHTPAQQPSLATVVDRFNISF